MVDAYTMSEEILFVKRIRRDLLTIKNETTNMDEMYDDQNYGDERGSMDMKSSAMLLASLYIIITVLGLTANGAVLYMIARSRRSKAVTSIYIFNLAIADLLYVVCLPAAVYPMLNGHWILGHMMCKLYFTCDGVSKFASVMFLVVLSFDRYMAVCHPIASRAARTAKVAFVASGASWLLVIVAMVPVFVYATLVQVTANGEKTLQCVIYWPATSSGHQEIISIHNNESVSSNETLANEDVEQITNVIQLLAGNETSDTNLHTSEYSNNETNSNPFFFSASTDWARRIFTLYLFTLSFSVPLLMVWIFYIMILHRLWKQKRNLFNAGQQTNGVASRKSTDDNRWMTKSDRAMLPANKANQRRRRSTKRVTIMVLSIVVAYTLCWLPYWCVQLTIEFFREDPALDFEIFTIISYIAYGVQSINSVLNPFLYAFGTHAHRRRLLLWFRRFLELCGCSHRLRCLSGPGNTSPPSNGARRNNIPTVTRYKADMKVADLSSVDSNGHVPFKNIKRHLTSKKDDDDLSGSYSKSNYVSSSAFPMNQTFRPTSSSSSSVLTLTKVRCTTTNELEMKNKISCFKCHDESRESKNLSG